MARHSDERKKFLEALETTPFINHASKKIGVSRATIYRWMKDNYRFKQKVFKALAKGRENLIEVAEVALVNKVRNGDMGAIKFFLSNNSKRYWTKSQIFEEELARDPSSAFRGPDGKIRVSTQMAEAIKKEKWKKEATRRKGLGLPNPDQEDATH